eukprot:365540-Chlamydomonas_euryale.AAC.15
MKRTRSWKAMLSLGMFSACVLEGCAACRVSSVLPANPHLPISSMIPWGSFSATVTMKSCPLAERMSGSCCSRRSMTTRPRCPPAHARAMPFWVTSSSDVGTYGGLKICKPHNAIRNGCGLVGRLSLSSTRGRHNQMRCKLARPDVQCLTSTSTCPRICEPSPLTRSAKMISTSVICYSYSKMFEAKAVKADFSTSYCLSACANIGGGQASAGLDD